MEPSRRKKKRKAAPAASSAPSKVEPSEPRATREKAEAAPDAAKSVLEVDDAVTEEDSVVALSEARLDALGLFKGDAVALKGKRQKSTVCIVMADEFLARC